MKSFGFAILLSIMCVFLISTRQNRSWYVSDDDLSIDLSDVAESNGDHQVEINRRFDGDKEAWILKKAEAVYPNKDRIPGYNQQIAGASAGESEAVWWESNSNHIRIAHAVTAKAVLYYHEISQGLRRDPSFIPNNRIIRSRLKYNAEVRYFEEYSHARDRFREVYVVILELEWWQTCGGLCGEGFKRKKEVVLGSEGNVLAVYLDAPENSQYIVS